MSAHRWAEHGSRYNMCCVYCGVLARGTPAGEECPGHAEVHALDPTPEGELLITASAKVEPHRHRCMRCREEFDCQSPGACVAKVDVLPTIITMGADGKVVITEHCPHLAPPRSSSPAAVPTASPNATAAAEASFYLPSHPTQPSQHTLEYKGYRGHVTLDLDAGVLFGEVVGLRDVITFEATSIAAVRAAFRESVDDYLAMCAQRGEKPEVAR